MIASFFFLGGGGGGGGGHRSAYQREVHHFLWYPTGCVARDDNGKPGSVIDLYIRRFSNCCLAATQPTLGLYQGGSPTNFFTQCFIQRSPGAS